MTDNGSLAGKVVLVTGASRGIGASIAERFAADGARVAVSARTVDDGDHPLPGSVTGTVQRIVDGGGEAVGVVADLGLAADRDRLVAEVQERLGPVDVLVNNAAVTYFEPVEAFDDRHYELMFEVQVRAPFELSRTVVPAMRERGRGWILNISSGAARHPQPPYNRRMRGGTVYGMCKAALERFTTGLAAELHADGIAVNVLSPSGIVATPGVLHHGLTRNVPADLLEPPEAMAEAAHVLCTGDPAELTGQVAYAVPLLKEHGLSVPRAGAAS
jgi:citronellol/citronellal dehydrogenase